MLRHLSAQGRHTCPDLEIDNACLPAGCERDGWYRQGRETNHQWSIFGRPLNGSQELGSPYFHIAQNVRERCWRPASKAADPQSGVKIGPLQYHDTHVVVCSSEAFQVTPKISIESGLDFCPAVW